MWNTADSFRLHVYSKLELDLGLVHGSGSALGLVHGSESGKISAHIVRILVRLLNNKKNDCNMTQALLAALKFHLS